jgi:membrane protease subunit HflC
MQPAHVNATAAEAAIKSYEYEQIGSYPASLRGGLAIASSILFVVDQRQFSVVFRSGRFSRHQAGQTSNSTAVSGEPCRQAPAALEVPTRADAHRRGNSAVIDWYVRWRISETAGLHSNGGRSERAGALQ